MFCCFGAGKAVLMDYNTNVGKCLESGEKELFL